MQIRYAVAGMPIQHSLSPVLAALTAAHLNQAGLEVEITEINLLESDDVTSPMAWAWVNKNRPQKEISNRLYGDPATPSSRGRLLELSSKVLSEVKTAHSSHVPNGETLVHRGDDRVKTRRGATESWISLASPLKHLLSPRSGIHPLDDSLQNGSVNHLRWDGTHWYCAGTDGDGLLCCVWLGGVALRVLVLSHGHRLVA